jgi:hypothetical protein
MSPGIMGRGSLVSSISAPRLQLIGGERCWRWGACEDKDVKDCKDIYIYMYIYYLYIYIYLYLFNFYLFIHLFIFRFLNIIYIYI